MTNCEQFMWNMSKQRLDGSKMVLIKVYTVITNNHNKPTCKWCKHFPKSVISMKLLKTKLSHPIIIIYKDRKETSEHTLAATGGWRPISRIAFIERSRSEAGRKKFGIAGHVGWDLHHSVKDTIKAGNKCR